MKIVHKAHRAVTAVFIAYLIIYARVPVFEQRAFGVIERVEKFGLPNPLPVRFFGRNYGCGKAVEFVFG